MALFQQSGVPGDGDACAMEKSRNPRDHSPPVKDTGTDEVQEIMTTLPPPSAREGVESIPICFPHGKSAMEFDGPEKTTEPCSVNGRGESERTAVDQLRREKAELEGN